MLGPGRALDVGRGAEFSASIQNSACPQSTRSHGQAPPVAPAFGTRSRPAPIGLQETHVKRRELMQTLAASLAAGANWPVWAQHAARPAGYPSKPLRIVVPFPPGGPADALARPLGRVLGEMTGQAVVIDNRPGANTMIGASNVLAAPADGYSLLLANEAGLSLAPAVAPYMKVDVPYDPGKDFAGISLLAQYGSILTVNPEVPAKTLPEFIAYAKKNPGKINYASFGNGSQPQMMMELLNRQAGIQTVHVPY